MPGFYDGIDFKGVCQNCNFLVKLPGISEGVESWATLLTNSVGLFHYAVLSSDKKIFVEAYIASPHNLCLILDLEFLSPQC